MDADSFQPPVSTSRDAPDRYSALTPGDIVGRGVGLGRPDTAQVRVWIYALQKLAGDIRTVAEMTDVGYHEKIEAIGRLVAPVFLSGAWSLLDRPKFVLWCSRHFDTSPPGYSALGHEVAALLGQCPENWTFGPAEADMVAVALQTDVTKLAPMLEATLREMNGAAASPPPSEADSATLSASSATVVTTDQFVHPQADAFLSETDLAAVYRVSQNSLRKRLRDWRPKHMNNDWIRVPHPRPRDAHYLYRVGSVLSLIQSLPKTGD